MITRTIVLVLLCNQTDTDNDGQGDACDSDDGDGVADITDVFVDSTESVDTDGDGRMAQMMQTMTEMNIPDNQDDFPLDPNRPEATSELCPVLFTCKQLRQARMFHSLTW